MGDSCRKKTLCSGSRAVDFVKDDRYREDNLLVSVSTTDVPFLPDPFYRRSHHRHFKQRPTDHPQGGVLLDGGDEGLLDS